MKWKGCDEETWEPEKNMEETAALDSYLANRDRAVSQSKRITRSSSLMEGDNQDSEPIIHMVMNTMTDLSGMDIEYTEDTV